MYSSVWVEIIQSTIPLKQIAQPTLKEEFARKRHENSDLSERLRVKFHQCRPVLTNGLQIRVLTPSLSRHNGTTIRGHEGTTHKAVHSRHCSLCAVLGSGRHNPTLMRRYQRVAGQAWRVRATSGIGASEPALPRSLPCDLVHCCCVMSYSVLILSTTVAIPQRCRQSLHRHRHPRRTTAADTAAAVRRLLCCGCGWCLAFVSQKKKKNWLFCRCGDDRCDRARPSCCAATHLAGPSPSPPPPSPPLPPPPPPLLFSLSRTRIPKVFCVRFCGRSMLLYVDSVHITGWHVFYLLLCFLLWNFYPKLSQMHAGVNLAFFKPDGRIFSDFV